MAKHQVTFVGNPQSNARREPQVSCGPLWPRGLKPGQSVWVDKIPDSCYGSAHYQFLVDGQVMERRSPELGPPRSKRKRTRYARLDRREPGVEIGKKKR